MASPLGWKSAGLLPGLLQSQSTQCAILCSTVGLALMQSRAAGTEAQAAAFPGADRAGNQAGKRWGARR